MRRQIVIFPTLLAAASTAITQAVVLTVRQPESEIRNFYRAQIAQKEWSVTELHHGGSGTLIATGDGKRMQIVGNRTNVRRDVGSDQLQHRLSFDPRAEAIRKGLVPSEKFEQIVREDEAPNGD